MVVTMRLNGRIRREMNHESMHLPLKLKLCALADTGTAYHPMLLSRPRLWRSPSQTSHALITPPYSNVLAAWKPAAQWNSLASMIFPSSLYLHSRS